jgi:hypothetical protein
VKKELVQDRISPEDEIKDGKKEGSGDALPDSAQMPNFPTPSGVVMDAVTFLNRLVSDAVIH